MALDWQLVLARLNRVPGFSATAQHVALFKDLYEQAQKENEQLKAECARLKAENEGLHRQIASRTEFEEIEGILWKRKPTGGFDSKPRCPNCQDHPAMGEFPPGAHLHWVCSRCNGVFDYVKPPS
jgi:hypothetical protein